MQSRSVLQEDGKAAGGKRRKEDPWESGSEAGGAKSSVDEESDDSDMEAEFYEALMEWGSPDDSELESGRLCNLAFHKASTCVHVAGYWRA